MTKKTLYQQKRSLLHLEGECQLQSELGIYLQTFLQKDYRNISNLEI